MADLKRLKGAKSVGGTDLQFTYHFITPFHVSTAKGTAHVQNNDIEATNGVIHIINSVLMP